MVPTHAQTDLIALDRLSRFLAGILTFRQRLPLIRVERIGGGQSNLTFRVYLQDGTVILRRPPLGPLPPSAHDVLREYSVLCALDGSAVPVPAPLVSCPEPEVLGAPFYLMEDLPGDAIRFSIPPELAADPTAPRAIAEQAVDALAALHRIAPATVKLDTLSKPQGYLERQLRRWTGQLEYARVRPVPDLDTTSTWLQEHLPAEAAQPSIVHGDYKLDNLLFAADAPARLLAVVDWEMAALGDPLADLGWLLAFWCEDGTPPRELTILPRLTEDSLFPRRQELADRYARRTNRQLPELRFYLVLALWKMAILLEAHWARRVRGTAGGFDFAYLEQAGPLMHAYVRRTTEGDALL